MVDKKSKNQPPGIDDDISGYVGFDDLGNAVWKWAPQPDEGSDGPVEDPHSLLKALENDELSLEDSTSPQNHFSGVDPYNSSGGKQS